MSLETRLKKLEAETQEGEDDNAPHPAWVAHREQIDAIVNHFLPSVTMEGLQDPPSLTDKQAFTVWGWIEDVIISHATTGSPLAIPREVTHYLLGAARTSEEILTYPYDCLVCGIKIPKCVCPSNGTCDTTPIMHCPSCGARLIKNWGYYWNHRGYHPNGLKTALPTTFEATVTNREAWMKKLKPAPSDNEGAPTVREQHPDMW